MATEGLWEGEDTKTGGLCGKRCIVCPQASEHTENDPKQTRVEKWSLFLEAQITYLSIIAN